MSRSYKKHPYCTDGSTPGTKNSKRIANKKVRRCKNKIANGKSYKKLFCSYEIHDWISRWTWEEAKADYYNLDLTSPWNWQDDYPTIKDFYKHWMKNYKRK